MHRQLPLRQRVRLHLPAQPGRPALTATDPQVFHQESTWWSVVVEQMWHGLF
ncbi:hypothetical protein [Streptomyces sp. TLI_171]|uniref:hypothetical protein n=1 Tax=Streptomyces sp. TLI_171 TaxID=1938859 RepID=UPI0015D55DE7|nr:hypothetical protein [Streptomyces sp. TLI_171]